MRKLNVFLVIGIFITFIAHATGSGLILSGADSDSLTVLARICICFVSAHVVVTLVLTVQTLRVARLSGASYVRSNVPFWIRRISGFTILIPLMMHLMIFRPGNAEVFRLKEFTTGRMISQILLVAALALHILSNIKPLLISLGVPDTKKFSRDILLILSLLLFMFAVAFAIYYLRWMAY